MGIGNYDYHKISDLKKILKCEERIKRNSSRAPEFMKDGRIKKIIFFSAWWNKNCALVISDEILSSYPNIVIPRVAGFPASALIVNAVPAPVTFGFTYNTWLVIWEEDLLKIFFLEVSAHKHKKIETATQVASSLIDELNEKNPICAVFGLVSSVLNNFSNGYYVEGVEETLNLMFNRYGPSNNIKSLDIVKVENSGYSHLGIYLGKDDYGNHKVAHVTKGRSGAKISDWNDFFNSSSHSVSLYHPFIPYKSHELIKEHIAQAVSSKEYQEYNLVTKNCQHFVNRCVLSLSISNEMSFFKLDKLLRNEIQETNRHFANLTIRNQFEPKENKKKIEKYIQNASQNFWEEKFESRIEISPKSDCKLQ